MKKIILATALVLSLVFVAGAKADQPQCVVNYFSVSPGSIVYGSSAQISWGTTNCTNVSIYGGSLNNSTNLPQSGTLSTNQLYGTTTFSISASGPYNFASNQTATVSVTNQYNQYNNNQSYYSYNQTFTPCTVSSFSASPTSVNSGGSTTLNWSTVGCDNVTITGPNVSSTNHQALSGSLNTGVLYGPTTYMLNASSNGSNSSYNYSNYYPYSYQGATTDSKSVMILVSSVPATQTPAVVSQEISIVTGTPTDVRSTSVRLNGFISQTVRTNSSISFEWGTSSSLGKVTQVQSTGSVYSTSFFDTLFNLYPNTTYYYRATVSNSYGTTRGSIQSFTTSSLPVTTNTVDITPEVKKPITTLGVGSGSNLVSFGITSSANNVCVGGSIKYIVSYKNISGAILNNAVIHVVLPADLDLQTANIGVYNKADRTVTLPLGTLALDQSGTMELTGLVTKSATNENLIVLNATIAFTNSANNSQESAIAYALNNTSLCQEQQSNVAGLALFGTGFWPATLIGWMTAILGVIILVLASKLFFLDNRPTIIAQAEKKNISHDNGYSNTNNYSNGNGYSRAPKHEQPVYEEMNVPTYEDGE